MRILAAFILCLCVSAHAATRNWNGTVSDFSTQFTAASSGDTILWTNAGSATWNSGITITSAKGVTVDFNGGTVTRGSFSSSMINVNNNATTGTRLTGGKFIQTDSSSADMRIMSFGGGFSNARFRVDNCWLTTTPSFSTIMIDIDDAWGLFHNCVFIAPDNSEMIHNVAYGNNDDTGWGETITPGSLNAVYIEDCCFTNNGVSGSPGSFFGCSSIQNYYGSRIVFRRNIMEMVHFDVHGTPGQIGGRWWEYYNNTNYLTVNGDQSDIAVFRAGSGVCFGNRKFAHGAIWSFGDLNMREEDSGSYPQPYQVGRGKDQTSDPAYFWDNLESDGTDMSVAVIEGGSLIQINRDYFVSAKPGYTPATYPHPDRGAGDSTPPTIQSVVINSNGTTMTVSYSETVTSGAGGTSGFSLSGFSGGAVTPTYSSGAGSAVHQFNLSRQVQDAEDGTAGYTQPGNGFEDSSGNDLATVSGITVDNRSTQNDVTAPTFFSASISTDGTQLSVIWSEPCHFGNSGGSSGMAISAPGYSSVIPTYIGGAPGSNFIYSLSRTVDYREVLTLGYTKPSDGIQDYPVGNELANFSGSAIANNSLVNKTDMIAASRLTTWNPGRPGGVPAPFSTMFANAASAPYSADSNGVLDASTAINSALAACPSGQYVLLPVGLYRASNSIIITNPSTVLRGQGTNTVIAGYVTNDHILYIGKFPTNNPADTSVSGSPAKGATNLTVSSITSPSISVGDIIAIDQINDGTEVMNVDDSSRDSGTRCLGQIVRVFSVSGAGPFTLGIDPPLHHAYSSAQTPQVWNVGQQRAGVSTIWMTTNCGIENLTVDRVQPTGTSEDEQVYNIKLIGAAYCWVTNVYSTRAQFRHIDSDRSFRNSIVHCYFNDGRNHGTGGFAYGVVFARLTAETLCENNRFRRLRHSMVVKEGASGNVFGYNMSQDPYQADGWLASDLSTHGSHAHFNLFEGNYAAHIGSDFIHGSSSYNTYLRNFIVRTSSSETISKGRRVVEVEITNYFHNFLGNVLGSQGLSWTAEESGTDRFDDQTFIWTFGFDGDGDTNRNSTISQTNAFRHGNYSARQNAVTWEGAYEYHNITNSLYLTGKPSWFGTLNWPVYESSAGQSVTRQDIPAGYLHQNGSDPPAEQGGGGPGSPTQLRYRGKLGRATGIP